MPRSVSSGASNLLTPLSSFLPILKEFIDNKINPDLLNEPNSPSSQLIPSPSPIVSCRSPKVIINKSIGTILAIAKDTNNKEEEGDEPDINKEPMASSSSSSFSTSLLSSKAKTEDNNTGKVSVP